MSQKRVLRGISSFLRRRVSTTREAALPPGSLIHVGDVRAEEMVVSVTDYAADDVTITSHAGASNLPTGPSSGHTLWVHVSGLHDTAQMAAIRETYDLHPLIVEDIINTHCHPKIEISDEYVFVILKMMTSGKSRAEVDVQHFALLLLPGGTVLTFLEGPSPVFDPVIKRIQTGSSGRIRSAGGDYLAWALLDALVDNYFQVIDNLLLILGDLEELLIHDPAKVGTEEVFALKKEVAALHRIARPVRDIATSFLSSDSALLSAQSMPYRRDLHDHGIQVRDLIDDLRETANSLRDFHLSTVSNRMNEVMKVLTCISTIFLPLSFLAGVYGMNFVHMPELAIPWAYPLLWSVFILTGGGLLYYFRKRRWL